MTMAALFEAELVWEAKLNSIRLVMIASFEIVL